MVSRPAAVAIARSWIKTPYILGGAVKGAGCDCATILAEYLIEIGRTTREELGELGIYSSDWFCHASSERYLRGLMRFGKLAAESFCRPGSIAQPGDLALFRGQGSKLFNHGSIVTAWPYGVHAYGRDVREVDLSTHVLTGCRPMAVFDPFAPSSGEE
jgi:cell wall-associated NlpC family hydrolase